MFDYQYFNMLKSVKNYFVSFYCFILIIWKSDLYTIRKNKFKFLTFNKNN